VSGARFTLSVDDGHPLDQRMAALLDRIGIRATFYFPLENIEGLPVLEPSAMRALAQGFEIGSHTRSHRFLTTLSAADAWRQISEGKQLLEDCLGYQVRGFCYPGGRYRRLHRLQVRSAGFDYARTTQNLRMDSGICPFQMPTSAQFYPHGSAVFVRNFVSQRDWIPRMAALRVALQENDWLQRLHRLLDLAIANDAVFHLWCHSVDIEYLQLWPALETFLRRVANDIADMHRLCNGALFSYVSPPAAMAALDAAPDNRGDHH
jgi:peptidoglycan/xylan/chitin deacetylase (PgdA/CDA1 family)